MNDELFITMMIFLGCLIATVSVSRASPLDQPALIDDSQSFYAAASTYSKPTYAGIKARKMKRKKRADLAAMEIRKESRKQNQGSFSQESVEQKGRLQEISQ